MRRLLGKINFYYVGVLLVVLALLGGYGGLAVGWQNSRAAQSWQNYAHELETRQAAPTEPSTAAQAVNESDTSTAVVPTSTMAPSITPAATSTRAPSAVPTAANTATAAPVFDWIKHLKLITGDSDWIRAYSNTQDVGQIRADCYDETVRSTVPITDVLDFGGSAIINVWPPYITNDAGDGMEDGTISGHVKISQGDYAYEADFTNSQPAVFRCLAAGNWRVEISGKHTSANGAVIVFDNAGDETKFPGDPFLNPWRYLYIHRGEEASFQWEFYWQEEWIWEKVK